MSFTYEKHADPGQQEKVMDVITRIGEKVIRKLAEEHAEGQSAEASRKLFQDMKRIKNRME